MERLQRNSNRKRQMSIWRDCPFFFFFFRGVRAVLKLSKISLSWPEILGILAVINERFPLSFCLSEMDDVQRVRSRHTFFVVFLFPLSLSLRLYRTSSSLRVFQDEAPFGLNLLEQPKDGRAAGFLVSLLSPSSTASCSGNSSLRYTWEYKY